MNKCPSSATRASRPRKKQFISLQRGYPGPSSTGEGLTAPPSFRRGLALLRADQHYMASPYPYRTPACNDAKSVIATSTAALHANVEALDAENVASASPLRVPAA